VSYRPDRDGERLDVLSWLHPGISKTGQNTGYIGKNKRMLDKFYHDVVC
jgi:hypothetical protein